MVEKKRPCELTLGFAADGGVGLYLTDLSGFGDKVRIFVGTHEKVAGITVSDKTGTPRASMWINEEEEVRGVAISIFDPSENPRASLFFTKEGDTNLVLSGGDKKVLWQALPFPE
mgnify:CR=1 FL=1